MATALKKQCTILQYVKGQILEEEKKKIIKLAVVVGLSITTTSKK
jgi:hypothetical protein